jgi:hypothetical protein
VPPISLHAFSLDSEGVPVTFRLKSFGLIAACSIAAVGCSDNKPISTNKDVEMRTSEKGKSMTATMEDPAAIAAKKDTKKK